MILLACLSSLLACQPPADSADALVRLGLDSEAAATVAAWRMPAARWSIAPPNAPSNATRLTMAQNLRANPLQAAARAEAYVREALAEIRPVPLLRAAAAGLGCARKERDKDLPAHIDVRTLEDILERAQREIVRALGSGRAPEMLAPSLQAAVDRVLLPGGIDGLTAAERETMKDLCRRAADVDFAVLQQQTGLIVRAAMAFAEGEAKTLARAPTTAGTHGVTGPVVFDRATAFGRLVIGGVGANEYDCEQLAVIIDLGGEDVYRGPVAGAGVARPMSVVIDLAGNDTYLGQNDGLGSAAFGVGLLLDLAGNDHYHGERRCAGFGAGGLGALFDLAGDDELVLARDGGGVGFLGIGVYLDAGAGKDRARVGSHSLGCGLPGGLGLFVDDGGDDEREVRDGTEFGRAACGAGLGVLGWLDGGTGLFVDVDGADHYTGGDLMGGAGTDGGAGVFFDAAGHDTYVVGAYALGSARTHGCGVFVDAAGDDSYRVLGPGLGSAEGSARGHAEERAGQDVYELYVAWPAQAKNGALATFFELAGKDRYRATGIEHTAAAPETTAAKAPALGLSVHEDRGGDDDVYDAVPGEARRGNNVSSKVVGDGVRYFIDH